MAIRVISRIRILRLLVQINEVPRRKARTEERYREKEIEGDKEKEGMKEREGERGGEEKKEDRNCSDLCE